MDGLTYRDRKLKAQLVEKAEEPKEQEGELDVPTYTFKANEELMKRMNREELNRRRSD